MSAFASLNEYVKHQNKIYTAVNLFYADYKDVIDNLQVSVLETGYVLSGYVNRTFIGITFSITGDVSIVTQSGTTDKTNVLKYSTVEQLFDAFPKLLKQIGN